MGRKKKKKTRKIDKKTYINYGKSLINIRSGKLIVDKYAGKHNVGNRRYWFCICDCGETCIIREDHIIKRETLSCGCEGGRPPITHGLSDSAIYNRWNSMIQRCTNPNQVSYPDYGGRGICVCDRWLNFDNFYEDMGDSFSEELSIDRIDNSGNYEPGNTKWSSTKEQCANRRSNIIINYMGNDMILSDLANLLGINYLTLYKRYRKGQRDDELYAPIETRYTNES